MKNLKLLSWNVDGIRAIYKNNLLDWLNKESPDVICFQETRAVPEQLEKNLTEPQGYYTFWNYAEKKGYGGVATFTKEKPLNIKMDFKNSKFDTEGRLIICEYPEFKLFNVYFPNGKASPARLKYKMEFYEAFLNYVEPLRKGGEKLVVCGDVNTAHSEIDLARPKENSKISGFLPEERQWIDKFLAYGWKDAFRHFEKGPDHYTWWSLRTGARQRNVGWRIDYFFITENLLPQLTGAFIMSDVEGSDHCPIGITLKVP